MLSWDSLNRIHTVTPLPLEKPLNKPYSPPNDSLRLFLHVNRVKARTVRYSTLQEWLRSTDRTGWEHSSSKGLTVCLTSKCTLQLTEEGTGSR